MSSFFGREAKKNYRLFSKHERYPHGNTRRGHILISQFLSSRKIIVFWKRERAIYPREHIY